MLIKTTYICEKCSTEYQEEAACKRCENKHLPVTSIKETGYNPLGLYPTVLSATMEDGKEYIFSRSLGKVTKES